MDAWTRALAAAPYLERLGIRLETLTAERVVLRLPFADANANPGRALHGGVTASAMDAAGALAAAAALGGADLELATLDLSVDYLAAAIGEETVTTAEVLRRGKELVYSRLDVRTPGGKAIAAGLATVRGAAPAAAVRRFAGPPAPLVQGDECIEGAGLFVRTPFMASLGIAVEQAHGGQARLAMACTADTRDADGAMHEGALAALIDSSGALASWSLVGLDLRYKASTVAIHVNFHRRVRGAAVVAHARTLCRHEEIFSNQVGVVAAETGELAATGSVTYRIVVP